MTPEQSEIIIEQYIQMNTPRDSEEQVTETKFSPLLQTTGGATSLDADIAKKIKEQLAGLNKEK
jgi:hypothetical protein